MKNNRLGMNDKMLEYGILRPYPNIFGFSTTRHGGVGEETYATFNCTHYCGDRPENALEALTFALRSDWTRLGTHRRHIVLLCTDAPALPLGARSDRDCYPTDMPKDLEELSKIWEEDMDRRAKRIFLYAPYEEPWDMLEMWTQCFHCDMDSYDKFDFDECLRMMSFS